MQYFNLNISIKAKINRKLRDIENIKRIKEKSDKINVKDIKSIEKLRSVDIIENFKIYFHSINELIEKQLSKYSMEE